jgi:hypothetical protein
VLLRRKRKGFQIVGSLEMNRRLFSAQAGLPKYAQAHIDRRAPGVAVQGERQRGAEMSTCSPSKTSTSSETRCGLEPDELSRLRPQTVRRRLTLGAKLYDRRIARGLVRPGALIRAAASFVSG